MAAEGREGRRAGEREQGQREDVRARDGAHVIAGWGESDMRAFVVWCWRLGLLDDGCVRQFLKVHRIEGRRVE